MTRLCGGRRNMACLSGFFSGAGPGSDSTGSAVIADVVCRVDVDGLAVCVVKVPATDIVHIRVIAELIVLPVAALVAEATIAVAIVDAAVEADFRTPIALIPSIRAIAASPVTGRPEITLLRANRLRIRKQRGWSDSDRDSELREGRGWYGQYYKREKKISNCAERTHFSLPCLIILRLPGLALVLRVARIDRLRDARKM